MRIEDPTVLIRTDTRPQTIQSARPTSMMPTHNTSRIYAHHEDLKAFAGSLQGSVNQSFFPNTTDYKSVHVLLLSWEGGDVTIYEQLKELQGVFQNDYKFQVEAWEIPSHNDNFYLDLNLKLAHFIREHDGPNNLMIVYYGGHGKLNSDQEALWMR
jgi:hypothetical protein